MTSLNRFSGVSVPEVVEVSHGRLLNDHAKTRHDCLVVFFMFLCFYCYFWFSLRRRETESSEVTLDALAAMKSVL